MGIYPEKSKSAERNIGPEDAIAVAKLEKAWTETVSEPGIERTRQVFATEYVETRTDCFCCTCDENEFGGMISDPFCRNHGYAGERPCDIHNLPGSTIDPDFNDGKEGEMPDSVLTVRERNRANGPSN